MATREVPAKMAMDDEAKLAAIRDERGSIYGDPYENHKGIAMMWAPILQKHWEAVRNMEPLPAWVVTTLIELLKINRRRVRFHQDNYTDGKNYLRFSEEFQREGK